MGSPSTSPPKGFETPRFMLLGPGQEILMSDSARANQGGGSVYVLLDKDRDGKIEQKTKIIEGLERPYGLALWKDYLYVAEPTSLKRYKYDAKAMKVTGPGEEVVSLKGFGNGHWTRSVIFDPKGEKMYLTVGSASNVDAGEDPMRAAVHRYNPDGSGHETFVTGTRNVIGLRWYPAPRRCGAPSRSATGSVTTWCRTTSPRSSRADSTAGRTPTSGPMKILGARAKPPSW